MRRVGRRGFALGLASIAACGGVVDPGKNEVAPDAPDPPPDPLPTPPPPPDLAADAGPCLTFPPFGPTGLDDGAPARRTLYTWTTTAQADALASDRILYTKTAADTGEAGWLFDFLSQRATQLGGDPIAKTLGQTDFRLGRFAWAFPWASLLGPEDYGLELVRIDLAAEALFAIVDSASGAYSAVDMMNAPVPIATALATPDRVAGIFFVNSSGGCGGTVGGSPGYREFHLCHEKTVTEWSLRTEENLAVIDDGIALLSRLTDAFAACDHPMPMCWDFLREWATPAVEDRTRFMNCLAFGWRGVGGQTFHSLVAPGVDRLRAARFKPAPVRHRPNG